MLLILKLLIVEDDIAQCITAIGECNEWSQAELMEKLRTADLRETCAYVDILITRQ